MDTHDAWKLRADELRLRIEALLEEQLCEYELLNEKLEEWKKSPGAEWLTMTDYEPWQAALKSLELAQRALDDHISVRPK